MAEFGQFIGYPIYRIAVVSTVTASIQRANAAPGFPHCKAA